MDGLGVRAGDQWLFRELDCGVAGGSCLAVVGPNGSGKSTFLHCLYGMQHPTEGTATVCDQPPDERDWRFRRRVSVLLDDGDLFVELTPLQHLELLTGSFDAAPQEHLDLLADAGLADRATVTAGSLSAGQRRRLLLLGATGRPFEVLLLDEPERALDAQGKEWLTTLVDRAVGQGAAVVLATHHPPLLQAADAVLDLS